MRAGGVRHTVGKTLYVTPSHLHPNDTFSRDTQGGVSKPFRFGLPGLWQLITPCSDLRSRWSLKKTCSSPWKLSNNVLHSTYTHRRRVDSRLLVVGSQIANLTPSLSLAHNLCSKYPNGSCEDIFGIYTSRPFQQYKEHFKARCFDPYNGALSFQESRRTLKSPFRECECHLHTPSKWGCDKTIPLFDPLKLILSLTRNLGARQMWRSSRGVHLRSTSVHDPVVSLLRAPITFVSQP